VQSQLILQQEVNEESNAAVLMEDNPPFDTFSSTRDTKDRWELWITGELSGQVLLLYWFPCIEACGGEWHHRSRLKKVDLEDPLSVECMNKMTMATKESVAAMICIVALKEGVVDQIMNAVDFEEINTGAIMVIMRN
jgi:hypothetical protein